MNTTLYSKFENEDIKFDIYKEQCSELNNKLQLIQDIIKYHKNKQNNSYIRPYNIFTSDLLKFYDLEYDNILYNDDDTDKKINEMNLIQSIIKYHSIDKEERFQHCLCIKKYNLIDYYLKELSQIRCLYDEANNMYNASYEIVDLKLLSDR